MNARSLLLLLLALASLGVAFADDTADIESQAQQWAAAFNARNSSSLTALATHDVVVLNDSGSPIRGSASASQAWLRAATISGQTIKSATKEIVVSGSVAWRIGLISYRRAGAAWLTSESLEIWKRTDAGWKLHRQMSSFLSAQTFRPTGSEPVLDTPRQ